MRMRTVALLGVLIGILLTLTVLRVRDASREIFSRLDHIEDYLSKNPIPHLMFPPEDAPVPAPQSHKGELSKPQQWKI